MTQAFAWNEEETDDDYDLSDDKLEQAKINFTQDFEGDDEFDTNIDLSQDMNGFFQSFDNNIKTEDKGRPNKKPKMPLDPDREFINSDYGYRLVFFKGEAFTSKKKKNFQEQKYIYKILSFYTKNCQKYAVCEKYMKRTDTDLMKHLNDEVFKQREDSHLMEYVVFRNPAHILLRDLDKKIDRPPSSNIFYDANKYVPSHGLDISYILKGINYIPEYVETPTVLELFAGCGGMSQGFINAGFDVKWAVEIMAEAVSSLEKNHPSMQVFPEDVRVFEERISMKDPAYMNIKPNHIHFSPPCQGFSRLNRNDDTKNSEKNNLSLTALKIVKHLQPMTVSMENVTGMFDETKGCRYYLRQVVSQLVAMGYSTRVQVLSCNRYGDPTIRSRVIVTAARCPLSIPSYPIETHSPDAVRMTRAETGKELESVLTPGDVLDDLIDIAPSDAYKILHTTESGTRVEIYNHQIDGTARKSEPVMIERNVPVAAIKRQANLLHYYHKRGLTIREYMRLHSFPDTHVLRGSLTKQKDQIGNSVPVRLATAVARAIGKSYPCFCVH